MRAERKLGRVPEEQHHSNPGYDVLSTDPSTGVCYFIEVKGHLPGTEQISVSRRQVGKAHNNHERWRLAVVSVPDGPRRRARGALPGRAVQERVSAPSPDQRPAERSRTAHLRRPPAITPAPRCASLEHQRALSDEGHHGPRPSRE